MSQSKNDKEMLTAAHTNSDPNPRGGTVSRRSLLMAGGAATLAVPLLTGQKALADDADEYSEMKKVQKLGSTRENYWDPSGKFFVQKNVDNSKVDKGILRARVDGTWQEFVNREIDDAFFDHNIAMRLRMFEVMTGTKQYEIYNDAHNAAVGTYGSNRGDSRFHVNVAFKGMGWLPTPSRIDARIKELEENYTTSMMKKMQLLYAGYHDKTLWDKRIIGSLELYTTQESETHTFLNQMINPVASICTLGSESYEFRVVTRLLHPEDPGLSDYEKKAVKYINFAHDFFHGGPNPNKLFVHNIGVLYYVVEEFDNSPFGATDTAGGQKRVPLA